MATGGQASTPAMPEELNGGIRALQFEVQYLMDHHLSATSDDTWQRMTNVRNLVEIFTAREDQLSSSQKQALIDVKRDLNYLESTRQVHANGTLRWSIAINRMQDPVAYPPFIFEEPSTSKRWTIYIKLVPNRSTGKSLRVTAQPEESDTSITQLRVSAVLQNLYTARYPVPIDAALMQENYGVQMNADLRREYEVMVIIGNDQENVAEAYFFPHTVLELPDERFVADGKITIEAKVDVDIPGTSMQETSLGCCLG